MNLSNIKLCRKCNEPFDIATDGDWCPRCRGKGKINKEVGDGERNKLY